MDAKQQNRILFLRWLDTVHPDIYKAAVVPAVVNHVKKAKRAAIGDLFDWGSPDTFNVSDTANTPGTSSYDEFSIYANAGASPGTSFGTSAAMIAPPTQSLSSNAGSIFSGILQAIPVLGQTYASTQGQLNLLQVNTQRAQQNLPPLTNVNGTLVTAAQLSAPNASTAAIERSITTGIDLPMMLLLGGGALLLLLVLGSRRK